MTSRVGEFLMRGRFNGYDVIRSWGEIGVLQISKVFCVTRGR